MPFFADAVAGGARGLVARLTRKNIKALPYWQAHPFAGLEGAIATNTEFETAMAKL